MVVMLLERFCQLVPVDAVAAVMRGNQFRIRQHTESAVDGGERYRAVEVGVYLCRRNRAVGSEEGLDDVASARCESDINLAEAIGDQIYDLRDDGLPSTLAPY